MYFYEAKLIIDDNIKIYNIVPRVSYIYLHIHKYTYVEILFIFIMIFLLYEYIFISGKEILTYGYLFRISMAYRIFNKIIKLPFMFSRIHPQNCRGAFVVFFSLVNNKLQCCSRTAVIDSVVITKPLLIQYKFCI